MKSNSIIDRFLLKVFAVSKVLSAVIVGLCFLVAVFTSLSLFFGGGKSLDAPDFAIVQSSLEETKSQQSSNTEDYTGLEKKRGIEKKFGDDINDIIKEYKLPTQAYKILTSDLLQMDEGFRSKFIGGLDDFLGDAQKYIKKQGDKAKIDITESTNTYRNMFTSAIGEVQASEIEAASGKMYPLGILGGSIIMLLAFIFIPLLIQIEQNTRKEQT